MCDIILSRNRDFSLVGTNARDGDSDAPHIWITRLKYAFYTMIHRIWRQISGYNIESKKIIN